ncbi:hypothetical protein [Archaeoglobus veneficus]|uniref:Uncharacterized protein n=1 Tax=Archaeoglobus veneficus (strain DSM 11195 / SNP6) TaxID=693661 RepID=F2KSI9_ARCVS|nr:hypothetical protein [Archaeoglobus veneficus]AEA48059.1 hypothetical protein Arcve_2069 [Archaeoglobus veneficus SNP6]
MVGIVAPNLAGLLGKLGGAGGKGFPKTLTKEDFGLADTAVKAGVWNKIGELKVPPQQAYRWGYGNPNQPYNQGYMYVLLQYNDGTTVTEVKGKVRLCVADANELKKDVVFEEREEVLHAAAADITKQRPLPEQGPIAREDDKLIIEFMPDQDGQITAADCDIRLPVTVYPAR